MLFYNCGKVLLIALKTSEFDINLKLIPCASN